MNDYLGSSVVGIHKYGLDTSSSQPGFKAKVYGLPGTQCLVQASQLRVRAWVYKYLELDGQGFISYYKTPENSNFLKNSKTVISVKIQNFSKSRMTKRASQ